MTTHRSSRSYDQRHSNLQSSRIKNLAISHNSAAAARKQQKTSMHASALLKRLRIRWATFTGSYCSHGSAAVLAVTDREWCQPTVTTGETHLCTKLPLQRSSGVSETMLRYFCYHFKVQAQVLQVPMAHLIFAISTTFIQTIMVLWQPDPQGSWHSHGKMGGTQKALPTRW